MHAGKDDVRDLGWDGILISYVLYRCTPSRFLRARKFDVPKAKVMLVAAEEWRVSFGVDDIVK